MPTHVRGREASKSCSGAGQGPGPRYSPETVFRRVRAHYHLTALTAQACAPASQARELVPRELTPLTPLPEVLLDARRGASRRVFGSAEDSEEASKEASCFLTILLLRLQELAKLVGATLIDFSGKSWASRVR